MKEVEKSTFNAYLFVLVLYRFHHYPLSAIELAPNAPYLDYLDSLAVFCVFPTVLSVSL